MTKQPTIHGNAFNFSYGRPLNALQVVQMLLEHMDRTDLQPQIMNNATNEIPHQFLDADKARQMLGWQPKFDFAEGLRRTIPWYAHLLGEGITK